MVYGCGCANAIPVWAEMVVLASRDSEMTMFPGGRQGKRCSMVTPYYVMPLRGTLIGGDARLASGECCGPETGKTLLDRSFPFVVRSSVCESA